MWELSEDQVADMEFQSMYLHESSTVTPIDIKTAKAKLVASVPMDGFEYTKVLVRFKNLLFKLFSPSCSLYLKLLDLVNAIWRYRINIIHTLPLPAKASILWIIHLQARHFAQGNMDSSHHAQPILPAFSMIYNQVCAGAPHMVSIAGLPA